MKKHEKEIWWNLPVIVTFLNWDFTVATCDDLFHSGCICCTRVNIYPKINLGLMFQEIPSCFPTSLQYSCAASASVCILFYFFFKFDPCPDAVYRFVLFWNSTETTALICLPTTLLTASHGFWAFNPIIWGRVWHHFKRRLASHRQRRSNTELLSLLCSDSPVLHVCIADYVPAHFSQFASLYLWDSAPMLKSARLFFI